MGLLKAIPTTLGLFGIHIKMLYRIGAVEFDFSAQADCITKSECQSYRGCDGTSIARAKATKELEK